MITEVITKVANGEVVGRELERQTGMTAPGSILRLCIPILSLSLNEVLVSPAVSRVPDPSSGPADAYGECRKLASSGAGSHHREL